MYSKLVIGLAMAAGASAAEIVRRDTAGGGGHDHSHSHAAAAPADGYGAPAASPSYSAPSTGYAQPSGGYAAPSTGYGYETTSYEEEGGFDLTAIIIPILILIGLSLLFPGIVFVNVRKRRDVGEEAVNPMTDVVERVNDIYMSVVESETCMERIACEIGGLAEDVGLKENSVAKMGELFVPSKYKAYYKQFQSGQNCHKIKCGAIF